MIRSASASRWTRQWLGTLMVAVAIASPVSAADVTGSYTGTWSSDVDGSGGDVIADLAQNGSSVSGSIELSGAACIGRANVSGTVNGTRLQGTFASPDNEQRGSFDLTIEDDRLPGTYRITAGCFDGDHGDVVLTRTNAPPTSTPTTGATRSPTPRTPRPCVGDCSGDGAITVDELVKGVNMGLGTAPVSQCEAFDVNHSDTVTVDELVQAVDGALNGCTGANSATPTATGTGVEHTSTPTATATPDSVTPSPAAGTIARRAAGLVVTSSGTFLGIADILPPLLVGAGEGEAEASAPAALAGRGTVPIPCPNDGTITVSCAQEPPRTGPPTYTLIADNCTIVTASGTQQLEGTITLVDQAPDHRCVVDRPTGVSLDVPTFISSLENAEGSQTTTFTNVSGTVTLSGTDPQCTYDQVGLRLDGTIEKVVRDPEGAIVGESSAEFRDTDMAVAIATFGPQCTLAVYTMTVDGAVAVTGEEENIDATYENYVLAADESAAAVALQITGRIDAACFGTPISIETAAPLAFIETGTCPLGGRIRVVHGVRDGVQFTETAGVDIDYGDDGGTPERFVHCLDPRLYECPVP